MRQNVRSELIIRQRSTEDEVAARRHDRLRHIQSAKTKKHISLIYISTTRSIRTARQHSLNFKLN